MNENEQIEVKKDKIKRILKNNIVVIIAAILAIISIIFVPFDSQYLSYFDFPTLSVLFLMSMIVAALRNIHFFRIVAKKIIKAFKTTRAAIAALVIITYISSMLIANDMALITFLPLGIIVLKATKKENFMIITFIMQNIAANLGGMLTPFGNPQNLYLFNYYNIGGLEFVKIMLLPTIVALFMMGMVLLFIKKETLEIEIDSEIKFDYKKTIIYFIFFIFTIVIVFRLIPFYYGFIILPLLLILDKKSILQVDYGLLLTFVMFFIFTGNISRMDSVKNFIENIINNNTLLVGVISCQFISNVPSAILLSKFTTNYADLLIAVNIAGCGTLVSSLASLITFRTFIKERKNETFKFLKYFTIINFLFLIILYFVSFLF